MKLYVIKKGKRYWNRDGELYAKLDQASMFREKEKDIIGHILKGKWVEVEIKEKQVKDGSR